MSTANKLTYLNVTKQKLKQAINNIGGEVTDNTTFRNYANQLQNVYDNLPKTEYQEGSNITLENTLKGKLDFEDGIVGIGDTSQKSYSGKNLYPSGTSTQTIAGVTFTPQEDGSLKLNGTSTYSNYYVAGGESNYVQVENLSNIAETVTLSVSGIHQEGIQVYVVGSTLGPKGLAVNGAATFTTTLNDTYRIFIRVMAGTIANSTIKIQLEKGSSATSFEKYVGGQASPSPSYPQDIEVVRGKNRLKSITIDRTIKGVKITSSDNGKITIKGTATDSINEPIWGSWGGSNVLCELPQGSYVSSGLGTNSPRLNIVANGTTTIFTGNSTRTLTNTAKITGIFLYINNGESVDMTFEPMIEKGSQATSYLPYNTLEVVERGKNLAKEVKIAEVTTAYNGVLYLDIENDLQPNTTYTLSFIGKNGYKVYLNENITTAQWVTCNGNKQSLTFTTSGNIDKTNSGQYSTNVGGWVIFKNQTGNTETATFTEVMLETGSTATTYEPYITPQTYQLSLGDIELNAIGNYKDELIYDVDEDKVYKNEKIKEVILNSSYRTSGGTTGTNAYYIATSLSDGLNDNSNILAYSNMFKGISFDSRNGAPDSVMLQNGSVTLRTRNNTDIDWSDNAKRDAWLNANTPLVYYVLATPVEKPITDTTLINQVKALYNAHSNNGTTIITSNGDLPMIIKVRGLKGE